MARAARPPARAARTPLRSLWPAALLLAGCQAHPGIRPMTCPTIPKPRPAEPAPPRPAAETPLALAPGHWEWADGGYDWLPQAWLARPPHPHRPAAPALWQGGYWTSDAGACVWTAGSFVS